MWKSTPKGTKEKHNTKSIDKVRFYLGVLLENFYRKMKKWFTVLTVFSILYKNFFKMDAWIEANL